MIERRMDEADNIIIVEGRGVWDRAEVDEHFRALRIMIGRLRLLNQPIRILSDVRGAVRQTREIEDHIREQMAQTYRAGDRIAVLTADMSDQTYVRERLGDAEIAAFKSSIAAEIWLVSDASRP